MKRKMVLLFLAVMAILLFGCGKKNDSGKNDTEKQPTQKPDGSESGNEKYELIDMEAFFTEIAKANPDADPDALAEEILKSPYFARFQMMRLTDGQRMFYPGMANGFSLQGLGKVAYLENSAGNTGALVYVVSPSKADDAQRIADMLLESANPSWWGGEETLDGMVSMVIDGKVFFAMYDTKMKPVNGTIAESARGLVDIFHEYLAAHPEASCLEIAGYLEEHQKFDAVRVEAVQPGQLTGFGDYGHAAEITGFDDGAALIPLISPDLFICYVFRTDSSNDTDDFIDMLRDNANLAWNVCMTADTVITEADGRYVLFIMCSEK